MHSLQMLLIEAQLLGICAPFIALSLLRNFIFVIRKSSRIPRTTTPQWIFRFGKQLQHHGTTGRQRVPVAARCVRSDITADYGCSTSVLKYLMLLLRFYAHCIESAQWVVF